MAPPHIPQEIINEIIRHLRHDPSTLKTCSLASSAFFPPSRRQLFSWLVLDTPRSLLRLHRLLKRSPEIANLVCTVHIHINTISRVSTPNLSTLLHQFTQLRHLIIGNDNNYFDWSYISPENAGSLEAVITSGTLHSLEFICVYHIPTSLICVASSVKSLTLEVSVLYEDTVTRNLPVTSLVNLENLHLGSEVVLGLNYWTPFTTLNLRRFSVMGTEWQTRKSMQRILVAASSSIQDIIWYEYSSDWSFPWSGTSAIDLGILSNLRFLSFVTPDYSSLGVDSAESTWFSIIIMLKNPAIVRNLERLSIVIPTSGAIVSDPPSGSLLGAYCRLWENMDTRLANTSHCPKFRQIVFYFDSLACSATIGEERLHTIMAEKLPFLESSRLLSVKIYQNLDWRVLL